MTRYDSLLEALGNTPAVARSAYVDPRVIDRYENGQTVSRGTEEEVRDLLKPQHDVS